MPRKTIVALCVILAWFGPGPLTEAAAGQSMTAAADYQLGSGDVVSIHVSGSTAFDQVTRVSNSGRIRVPHVGIMLVVGMTALELEREIARLIVEHRLINEPSVRVEVQEHRAWPTYVIGAVAAPGQFVITRETYLLDLIGHAGGIVPAADKTAFLYRRHSARPRVEAQIVETQVDGVPVPQEPASVPIGLPADEGPVEEVLRIDLDRLTDGLSPDMNVRLLGGEILYVPRARQQNIYIIGDVTVPGVYTLPRRGAVTAAQAVIYAGGPLRTASMGNSFLMRHDESGNREAIAVDFSAIIEGKEPDIPVRPGDIIYIPNSTTKAIGASLLDLVPRLIQQFLIF